MLNDVGVTSAGLSVAFVLKTQLVAAVGPFKTLRPHIGSCMNSAWYSEAAVEQERTSESQDPSNLVFTAALHGRLSGGHSCFGRLALLQKRRLRLAFEGLRQAILDGYSQLAHRSQ